LIFLGLSLWDPEVAALTPGDATDDPTEITST